MLQWIYELLMSKQDKQVVVQIMQLWLAKPKAFKVVAVKPSFSEEYSSIKSSEFSVEYNLSNGECKLGDLRLQTGWFARKMLQMFATQQALLSFHENAAKKLLAEDVPVEKRLLTANEKREQENAYDATVMGGTGLIRPPFTHQQIEQLNGKNVSILLDGREWHTGEISCINECLFSFKETMFSVDGCANDLFGKLKRRKIVGIRLDGCAECDGDALPQSVIVKKLYKEKQPTVLKPPFTEEQIKAISGKKVTAKLRNRDVRTGTVRYLDDVDYPVCFLGTGYTLRGGFFTQLADGRDIMEIKLDETT